MNQRILLFIVIFLGFLIIVGTTVVITTVIERSKNVDLFENTNDTEFHSTCGTAGIEDVIKLEDQKILIKEPSVETILLEVGLGKRPPSSVHLNEEQKKEIEKIIASNPSNYNYLQKELISNSNK